MAGGAPSARPRDNDAVRLPLLAAGLSGLLLACTAAPTIAPAAPQSAGRRARHHDLGRRRRREQRPCPRARRAGSPRAARPPALPRRRLRDGDGARVPRGLRRALRLARAPDDPDSGQPRVGQPRRRLPAVLARRARAADARLAPAHPPGRLAGAVAQQRGTARRGLAAGPLARAGRAPARAPAGSRSGTGRAGAAAGTATRPTWRRSGTACADTPGSSSPATTTTSSASPTATGCARSSPAAAGGPTSRCREGRGRRSASSTGRPRVAPACVLTRGRATIEMVAASGRVLDRSVVTCRPVG